MAEPDESECAEDGCTSTIKNHRWGRTKADGWFEQRDGTVWCPDHRPAWYAGWRARQQASVSPTE